MTEPLLICLTAPGFRFPFRVIGAAALCLYESPENTGLESRRMGLCWVRWKAVAIDRPRPRPKVWGRNSGRRSRREAIVVEVVVIGTFVRVGSGEEAAAWTLMQVSRVDN
jgi:hypothetical protein